MRKSSEHMLGELLRASHLLSLEKLPDLLVEHLARVGFSEPMIYLTDLRCRLLLPLPGQYDGTGQPLKTIRIDTTVAGLAFRNVDTVHSRACDPPSAVEEPHRVWVPLLNGTERLGVLGVTVLEEDGDADALVRQLSDMVSLLIVSKRDTSDVYAALVRADRMSISAEVLWNLMPSSTFANDRLVVSAMLEPAYDVGGDTYDYAVNGDTLHLGIFDAMGHDLSSGLTATIAMSIFRNSRRLDMELVAIGELIDDTIHEHFDPPQFTTGIMASLDTTTGRLSWVNRGHYPPLVLRQGSQVATLENPPSPPMGFGLGFRGELAHYQLEPGDRLVFYTDGVIEARNPEGELFGLERFIDFIIRREADELSTPETLRRLVQTILEHQNDRLQDDATVMLVEWDNQRAAQLTL